MMEEPCSLIIGRMPDTKHGVMYWKLQRTLIKSKRLNSAGSSLMRSRIIFWEQREEERDLIKQGPVQQHQSIQDTK